MIADPWPLEFFGGSRVRFRVRRAGVRTQMQRYVAATLTTGGGPAVV